MIRSMTRLKGTNNRDRESPPCLLSILRKLVVFVACLFALTSFAEETTPNEVTSNIIDGLTYADKCLYMLESTRQNEQPDCDKLFLWHEQDFSRLPAEQELQQNKRKRFERNLKLYHSTLAIVRKILASEVP
ncbi:MAG: hypothetical protein ACJAVI_001270 [Candidatus Azotimanducaceae bacterium]|jgi:hypothetical protein